MYFPYQLLCDTYGTSLMISKNKLGAVFVGAVLMLSVIAVAETFGIGYAQSVDPATVQASLKPGTYKEVYKIVTTGKLPSNADTVWGVYPDVSDCDALQVTLYPDYFTDVGGYEAVTFKEKIRVPESTPQYTQIHCEVSFWEHAMTRGDATVDMATVIANGDLIGTQVIWIKVLRPFTCHGQAATIVGTQGDDRGEGATRIIGTDGPDVIVALGGNDEIVGNGGDDIICAGDGHDVVIGDSLGGEMATDGNDKIILGKGNDIAVGNGGNDRIFGNLGNDILFGGSGNDNLGGGPGDDVLFGDQGDDTLVGLTGFDQLFGGPDKDNCFPGDGEETDGCENVFPGPKQNSKR